MNQANPIGMNRSFPCLKTLKKDETIFHQNEEFKGYYLVKSGLVKTIRAHESGARAILSFKIQGELMGELVETEHGKKHSYSAIALEENSVVELIPFEDPSHLKLLRILENLQLEILQARTRLERILFQDAEQRIKLTLKDLALRMGRNFGGETLLKLPVTHEDLAILTDTSRQTVSMVLSGLKSQNKITYSRGRILFRNLETF
ncbi:CRP/FNR family transcriptional regulator [Algoriphagus boseongensis]|uniref:CRP/FNR family transcriptional regulator n=1 Tax=Algoriphagus boseongensis TaxID=1442587 RepID=A0A4R6T9P1_9BACT|nr:Crp/Fnr family transcriptional regulator [Algoriphagus boseongensis]TDQ19491.1 CRP/FNR family transcriptional regulator [Algoriphagus boseongensis]